MSASPPPLHRPSSLVIAGSALLFLFMVRGVVMPVLVSGLFAILLDPLLARLGGLLERTGLESSPEKLKETLVTSAQEGGGRDWPRSSAGSPPPRPSW